MRCSECGSAALETLAPGYLKCSYCGTPMRDMIIGLTDALTQTCFCGRTRTGACTVCRTPLCDSHNRQARRGHRSLFTTRVGSPPGTVAIRVGSSQIGTPEEAAFAAGWNAQFDRIKCEACRTKAGEEARESLRSLSGTQGVEAWIELAGRDCLGSQEMDSVPIDSARASALLLAAAQSTGFAPRSFSSLVVTPLLPTDMLRRPESEGYWSYDPWNGRQMPPPIERGTSLVGYRFIVELPKVSDFILTETGEYWSRQPPIIQGSKKTGERLDGFKLTHRINLKLPQAWFVAIAALRQGPTAV